MSFSSQFVSPLQSSMDSFGFLIKHLSHIPSIISKTKEEKTKDFNDVHVLTVAETIKQNEKLIAVFLNPCKV